MFLSVGGVHSGLTVPSPLGQEPSPGPVARPPRPFLSPSLWPAHIWELQITRILLASEPNSWAVCWRDHLDLARDQLLYPSFSPLQAPGRPMTTSSVVGTHSVGVCHPAAWRTPTTGPVRGVLWPSESPSPHTWAPSCPTFHPGLIGCWPPGCPQRDQEHSASRRKLDMEVQLLLLPAQSP